MLIYLEIKTTGLESTGSDISIWCNIFALEKGSSILFFLLFGALVLYYNFTSKSESILLVQSTYTSWAKAVKLRDPFLLCWHSGCCLERTFSFSSIILTWKRINKFMSMQLNSILKITWYNIYHMTFHF